MAQQHLPEEAPVRRQSALQGVVTVVTTVTETTWERDVVLVL